MRDKFRARELVLPYICAKFKKGRLNRERRACLKRMMGKSLGVYLSNPNKLATETQGPYYRAIMQDNSEWLDVMLLAEANVELEVLRTIMGDGLDTASSEELNVLGEPSSQATIITRQDPTAPTETSNFSVPGAHNSVSRILKVREKILISIMILNSYTF